MGVVRNFIEVVGIASEDDLPEKTLGQFIKYNEAENIFISEDKPGIKDIYQIAVNIGVKSKRIINSHDSKTVVIDGVKKLKIVYSQDESSDKLIMLNLQLPYNTFVEIPREVGDIDNIFIHILDAYFEVLEKRRIYGHFLYLLDVRYTLAGIDKISEKNTRAVEIIGLDDVNENDVPQIALSHEDFVVIDETDGNGTALSEEVKSRYDNEGIDCLYL